MTKGTIWNIFKFGAGTLAGIGAEMVVGKLLGVSVDFGDRKWKRMLKRIGCASISGMVGVKVADYVTNDIEKTKTEFELMMENFRKGEQDG